MRKMKTITLQGGIAVIFLALYAGTVFAAAPAVTKVELLDGVTVGANYNVVVFDGDATASGPDGSGIWLNAGESTGYTGTTLTDLSPAAAANMTVTEATMFGAAATGYGQLLLSINAASTAAFLTETQELGDNKPTNSNTNIFGSAAGPVNKTNIDLDRAGIAGGKRVRFTVDLKSNVPHLVAVMGLSEPRVEYTAATDMLAIEATTFSTTTANADNFTSVVGFMIFTASSLGTTPLGVVAQTNSWLGDIFPLMPGFTGDAQLAAGIGPMGSLTAKCGTTIAGPSGQTRNFNIFFPDTSATKVFAIPSPGGATGGLAGYQARTGDATFTEKSPGDANYTVTQATNFSTSGYNVNFNYTFASKVDAAVGIDSTTATAAFVLSPTTADLLAGQTQDFTTTLLGTWAVTPIAAGDFYKSDCTTAIGSADTYTKVCFKASTTLSENTTYTLTATAYGGVYYTSANGQIFANPNFTTPAGYVDGVPATYPLMTSIVDSTYTVTVGGGSGTYSFTVENAGGDEIIAAALDDTTYLVNIETLFTDPAGGAGVYKVIARDSSLGLTPGYIYIKVPLRIAPLTGSWTDTGTSAQYTVTAGSTGGNYTWTVMQEDGTTEFTNPAEVGVYTCTGSCDTSFLDFTAGLSGITTFRARVESDNATLITAGLDKVMTDSHVVVPIVTLNINVIDTTNNNIQDAVITATHDQSYSDTTDINGLADIAGLQHTGVTYNFAVTPPSPNLGDHLPGFFSVTDLGPTKTVVLQAVSGSGSLTTVTGRITAISDPTGYTSPVYVKLLQDNATYVKNSAGSDIQVLADNQGDYTLTYDTATATGPYTVVAVQNGAATNVDDNLSVIGSVNDGDTGRDITMTAATRISITDDDGLANLGFTIFAAPSSFSNTAGEIKVYDGTSAAGPDVTGFLTNGGADGYSYITAAPGVGSPVSIFVQADTSPARSATTGYYATAVSTVTAAAADLTATTINNPTILTTTQILNSNSGNTTVQIQAGGIAGEIIPQATLTISESNAANAGAVLVTASDLIEVTLKDTSTNQAIADINKIYLTITFDTAKVAVNGLAGGGTHVILHAEDMTAMVNGTAPAVSSTQIVSTDYAGGKVTFWTDSLSVFGIGRAPAITNPLLGSGGGCFIATATSNSPAGWILLSLAGLLTLAGLIVKKSASD